MCLSLSCCKAKDMLRFEFCKLILASAIIHSASSFPGNGRIIGGDEADITAVPYQLALQSGPVIWTQTCGATIISERTALTAGHCTLGFTEKQLRLRAGSSHVSGGSTHNVQRIIVHEKFTLNPADYDIAIIVVDEPFVFSAHVQPASLAISEPLPGENALVSGWGVTREGAIFPPTVLRKVEVPIVNKTICAEDYIGFENIVTKTMICAGEKGKDSCQGDSGGPLVINGTLVGIVSWGNGCGQENYPGVYTSVAFFADWLEANNATGYLV